MDSCRSQFQERKDKTIKVVIDVKTNGQGINVRNTSVYY